MPTAGPTHRLHSDQACAQSHVEVVPSPATPISNEILALTEEAEAMAADHWRHRIVARLAEQLIRESREGLPLPMPSSEQEALGIIKGVANDLRTASRALFAAAQALKDAGKGHQASLAHQAAQDALNAAEDLIGA